MDIETHFCTLNFGIRPPNLIKKVLNLKYFIQKYFCKVFLHISKRKQKFSNAYPMKRKVFSFREYRFLQNISKLTKTAKIFTVGLH